MAKTERSFWGRLSAGIKAFKEEFVIAGLQDVEADFSDFDARRLRYEMYWAFYENTAYRDIHDWARRMKADYGLYRWIRNIYNPSYRLAEFWKMHIYGGNLDPQAGDGKFVKTSIPIMVPEDKQENEEALRASIARTWQWSSWQIYKDLLTLYGPVFGDVPIMVVDDVEKNQVYLDIIHPGKIYEMETDRKGNIKSYTLVEQRYHPENETRVVTYKEEATREGDDVIYRTYLDENPYAWDENNGEEWSKPYGFIPMVLLKHNDVGLDWGWSEFHPGRAKFQELDDLASKTHDHIRKSVDPGWFLSGVTKSKANQQVAKTETDPTTDRPQPGREELTAIYASDPRARAEALIAELDLGGVVSALKEMMEEIERDYPELQMDVWRAIQTNSGRALRLARQRSEVKVIQRRANYDDALVHAQQMAISIGGYRAKENGEGFDEFAPFDLDSYKEGDLEHYIGNRAVYGRDPLDDLEIEEKFWTVAQLAVPIVGLEFYLRKAQWDDKDITRAVEAHEKVKKEGPQIPTTPAGDNGRTPEAARSRVDRGEN